MKVKRFISGVAAMAVSTALMVPCMAFAADTDTNTDIQLSGQHVNAQAGSQFSMNFDLSKVPAQGFSGCEFAITYDPTLVSGITISEGDALNSQATSAELGISPEIKDNNAMVNKGDYNCFDYNFVTGSGKTTIALLWCTGLKESKFWTADEGTMFTISGTVSPDAKPGDEVEFSIVPIDRDGNNQLLFGYTDGDKDYAYSTSVVQDGLLSIGYEPFWGDVNCNGTVSASDLVAMVQYMIAPEKSPVSDQGKVNGNLYQGDGITDLTDTDIFKGFDLYYLKLLLLEDIDPSAFPITK
ncbi:MAG: cohesin domain-containing protein [Oscillospiraceae bacterium]|nr:cohesin domain-containing protein [Oscillospiraceae bacterium]